MSLSLVHIVFVVAAIALSVGVGAALVLGSGQEAVRFGGLLGVGWFVCAAALAFYGRRVARKLQALKR